VKINGHTIEFNKKSPDKEGTFLWKNSLGVEIITVKTTPIAYHGGVEFGGQLGVMGHRGRHPSRLSGEFAEIKWV
jgi:hypothetical protein